MKCDYCGAEIGAELYYIVVDDDGEIKHCCKNCYDDSDGYAL